MDNRETATMASTLSARVKVPRATRTAEAKALAAGEARLAALAESSALKARAKPRSERPYSEAEALAAGEALLREVAASFGDIDDDTDPNTAEVIALLGGADAIDAPSANPFGLALAISVGFSAVVVTKLKEVGYTTEELSTLVAPERTLRARTKIADARLTAAESDACERLARALVFGRRAIGSHAAALSWLRQPHWRFGYQPTLDLLRSSVGLDEVISAFAQIEYGHPV